ncbi:glycoside hydrolase family 99-like domain-containing protein [Marinilongibacter aquaticus]|uniref:glycosyltransferase WbsX family protein n=1 Tax=Marinilongibacter aquaticus TaxID=2975157 RepID=UPI0021BD7AFE|nr:glycoside hydrolase family 99-like domain-containing protein [Marinilongibacter aquaticus]UBM57392.1 glycoside hydrolase family 99-like domain-containing protein [Marinilongibacter aquaticus]
MIEKKLRALAVILPQFHPIPENDKWWGKGFTEWTNVTKATPRFSGHYQPHLPTDLGFYDLRLADSREEQAKLAQEYDIHGFCIHHYWFNGKQLLETPVNEMLRIGKPDFPFMLCWANENWTRRWDGLDQKVLMRQDYSPEDHRAHAKFLCETAFADKRYITVDGKPFFLFFNTHIIPDLKESIAIWRDEVKKHGFKDIYLAGVKTSEGAIENPDELGFDAVVEWQPDWKNLKIHPNFWQRIKQKLGLKISYFKDNYAEVVQRMLAKPVPESKHYQCVMPAWDNTARKSQRAFIIDGSTPELYQEWLDKVCTRFEPPSDEENFVFINAWNEWAEGNHLEPDRKWGRAYLEATKNVLKKFR